MPNMGNYFIDKFKLPFKNGFYKKCSNHNCKICKYSLDNNHIVGLKEKISINSVTSCNSFNIIYIIQCFKCNKLYIGESKKQLSLG